MQWQDYQLGWFESSAELLIKIHLADDWADERDGLTLDLRRGYTTRPMAHWQQGLGWLHWQAQVAAPDLARELVETVGLHAEQSLHQQQERLGCSELSALKSRCRLSLSVIVKVAFALVVIRAS